MQIKVQILTKNLILKHLSMYRTIRYNTIHMILTLYRTIHEHLRYTDTIRNFFHTTLTTMVMHSSTPMCTETGHIQSVPAFKTNSKCRNMREAHFPHLRTDPMYINVKHVLDSIYFFLEESCSRV